jgi:2,4-dienoyl-CoA reductase (NADPH2)
VHEHVFTPGRIGPLQLPHRLVMGAMHLGIERQDDSGRALAAFYGERAQGGAGLIVTGGSAVSRVGAGGASYSLINEDADVARLEAIPAAVHAAGGRVLLQLFHAGRYASRDAFGLDPVAPSAVYSRYSRCEPRALSEEEILATIEDFARGAARARELGFDGVEIMGSEGYLLSQFMAPATNLREDRWGGELEGRMRFPLAVAAAVRAAVGPDRALVYRLSGADLVPGGASIEEVCELGSRLASGPADALNVGIGWHESRVPTVQAAVPPGAWAPWARAVREAVSVPVIASNRVNTVALADRLVGEGACDFVSLARPFLADPLFVRRGREGRRVNACIACNQCIDASIFDRRVSCAVNPRAGFESQAPVRGDGVSVAVAGGGPAGMEAARALAASGFAVTLWEASEELGGQRCPRDARPDERPHGGEGRGGLGESHDARPDLHVAGSLGQLDVPARRRGDRGRSGRPRGPDRVVSCRLVSKGAGRRRRATAAQRSATVILEAHEDAGGPRRAGGPLHEHAFADGGSGPPPRTGERARLRASGPVRPPEPRPAPTPPSGRRSCATRSGPRSTRRGRTGGPRRRP